MKYFTRELWLGFNSNDEATFAVTMKRWERNGKAYSRQLERLKPRLSQRAAKFFGGTSLHDGRVLAFVAGDRIHYRHRDLKSLSRNKGRAEVFMDVLNFEQDWVYRLIYSKVRRIVFDFPSDEPLFHEEGDRINDWGYAELTAADKSYLRHEVLFSSGATILIEFQRFSFERKQIRGSKGPVF